MSDVHGFVEAALSRELVRGELRRARAMAVLLSVLLALVLAMRTVPILAPAMVRTLLHEATLPICFVLAGFLVYELAVGAWLARLVSRGDQLPRLFRYFNVLVETSMPTVGMLLGASLIGGGLPMLVGAGPFVYFLLVMLSALNLDPWLCLFSGVVAGLQLMALSFVVLGRSSVDTTEPALLLVAAPFQYVVKGLFLVIAGAIAAFVARQIRGQVTQVVETLDERDRAVSIFGQHVSPQVADLLLRQPVDYRGQEQICCVMFLDIRDFSSLASERTAPEVVDYLNALFGTMIPVVNRHNGFVNKFLGDGFMAVFGAPVDKGEPCRDAVAAAKELIAEVERLNRDGNVHPTRIGIGLHVGKAVTGNVGTAERKEYTIIGDVVNLASRIEQANKQLGSSLLVSEPVARAVDDPKAEDVGLVELKGQPQPVRLYRLG
jgi:adenylate cyclase